MNYISGRSCGVSKQEIDYTWGGGGGGGACDLTGLDYPYRP